MDNSELSLSGINYSYVRMKERFVCICMDYASSVFVAVMYAGV